MAGAKASAFHVFSQFFFTVNFSNPSDQCFRQKRLLRAQMGESLFEMMTSSNWMPMVSIVSRQLAAMIGLCLPDGSVETSFWRVANWGIPF